MLFRIRLDDKHTSYHGVLRLQCKWTQCGSPDVLHSLWAPIRMDQKKEMVAVEVLASISAGEKPPFTVATTCCDNNVWRASMHLVLALYFERYGSVSGSFIYKSDDFGATNWMILNYLCIFLIICNWFLKNFTKLYDITIVDNRKIVFLGIFAHLSFWLHLVRIINLKMAKSYQNV